MKIKNLNRLALIVMIFIITLLCNGCLSSKERAEGRRNITEAKPHLKEYIKEHYGNSAKITDYSYVTWTDIDSTVASRDVGISSCVTANIKTKNGNTYTIMYDLNTGEYRSDEYLAELKPELQNMMDEELGFTGAFACDIDFQDEYLDVNSLLPVDEKPKSLTELYGTENVNYLELMLYCTGGDWDEYSFQSEEIRNKLGSVPLDENKGFSIYILNMYDKASYDDLKSQEYSEFMWHNVNNLVDYDGALTITPPEESYIGKYASCAYLLRNYQGDLYVYSINETSILDLDSIIYD
jgi:hypothetical protein